MGTILEAKGVCKFFGGLKAVPEKRHFLIAVPEYILQLRESFI